MKVVDAIPADSLATTLPWQTEPWQRLQQMIANDRLPHAFLLSGTQGIGMERFALAVAHFLICESPGPDGPCGLCRQCGFNKAKTHPDLKIIEPEEDGKQVKVDQIRDLVAYIGHTSQQGGYKIIIVRPAEAMNSNSANALLKSLEEPSDKTLLILLTHAPSQLLATIRSRCHSLSFAEPTPEQAKQWLISFVASEEQSLALLKEAAGQPLTALSLLESGGLARLQQMNLDFLSMISGKDLALSIAHKWLAYDLRETLIWMTRRVSDLIRWRCAQTQLAPEWQVVAKSAQVEAMFALSDNILTMIAKLDKGANPNKQLTLECLLLESCEMIQKC